MAYSGGACGDRGHDDAAAERYEGTGSVIAILLIVVALAATAEVVAGRAVVTPEPPRASASEPLAQADAPR
jgi:hypothetical protein